MTIDYVKKTAPSKIDSTSSGFHVPLKQIYVGMAATATLREMEADETHSEQFDRFRTDCKNFLVEAILQIQKRFDLAVEIHTIQCIMPANAAALLPSSLEVICQKLPYLRECLDTRKLDREWRQHVFESEAKSEMSWDKYWRVIRDAKTVTGEQKYPSLMQFVSIIASFPFSNAAVERTFSALKQVKSDRRSSLKSSSLKCKAAMKNGNTSAAKLQPSKQMLEFAAKMKANATDEQAKELRKKFIDEFSL